MTPSGLKTGSSVIEVRSWESKGFGPIEARGVRSEAEGQAVFVDLGDGKNLIGILGWDRKGLNQSKIFGLVRAALAPNRKIDWKEVYTLKGKGILPEEYIPTLISFSNLSDPNSAVEVPRTDFEKIFGQGFRFEKATLETTNEPITKNLKERLLWWSQTGRPSLKAYLAFQAGNTTGGSVEPELFFQRE